MHQFRQRRRLGLIGLTTFALLTGTAHAADNKAKNTPVRQTQPWVERAHPIQIDRRAYAGHLNIQKLTHLIGLGEKLFTAKFTALDGAGRPFATQAIVPTRRRHAPAQLFQRTGGSDANSCAGCHNDPLPGGAGGFAVNAFVSEGFTTPDFDTVDPQFSNERNTNHLFGAGLIELLAREMTSDLHAIRRLALRTARKLRRSVTKRLVTKGVDFGAITAHAEGIVDHDQVRGVDSDLVIRPFSHKGVIVSLRQFTINALNHHHGMQAVERFGPRWTGSNDFDGDGHTTEISPGDVTALVAWQATRPAPTMSIPTDPQWRRMATRGSKVFDQANCASCHVRSLPLRATVFRDPGGFDSAGTLRAADVAKPTSYDLNALDWFKRLPRNSRGEVLVPLFGDLKRHRMTDNQVDGFGNELLSQRFVGRAEFQTSELWGLASTAPYGHRGDFTTLDAVIRAHGGDARASRDAYVALSERDRSSLIAFLKTLIIQP